MSVYRRPSGKWVAQVYDPATRTRRQVGTFATKREARRAEAEAMGRQTATARETVGSFAERWPVDFPRPRASTNVHNAGSVTAFARAYDRRRMDSITIQEARAWALRHPARVMALRAMFNDARRSGIVVSNPFKELGIERSRGRRDLPSEWLTAADVDRLAQCAREVHGTTGYGDTIASLLVFAAYTGLRPGELYALGHDDLGAETVEVRRAADSHTRTLTLPKNDRARGRGVSGEGARGRRAGAAPVGRRAGVPGAARRPALGLVVSLGLEPGPRGVRPAQDGAARAAPLLRDLTCSSWAWRRSTWLCSSATPTAARS